MVVWVYDSHCAGDEIYVDLLYVVEQRVGAGSFVGFDLRHDDNELQSCDKRWRAVYRAYTYEPYNSKSGLPAVNIGVGQVSSSGNKSTLYYSITKLTDSLNRDRGAIDALGNMSLTAYGAANSYSPSNITDSISLQQTPIAFGTNYSLQSVASPMMSANGDPGHLGVDFDRSTTDYLNFPLAPITSIDTYHYDDAKPTVIDAQGNVTNITYYPTSSSPGGGPGFINTVTSTGAIGDLTSTFSYDTLGNISRVVSTGPNDRYNIAEGAAVLGIATTYEYTGYPGYSQSECLGEPTQVSVTGLDASDSECYTTSYYQYYSTTDPSLGSFAGAVSLSMDALGNITRYCYNLAGQLTRTIYPATGLIGPGNAESDTVYQYVGGPPSAQILKDENGDTVREVDIAYDAEGDVVKVTGSTQPATYTYDPHGRVTSVTDGNGNKTQYTYDQVDNLTGIFYPGWSGTPYINDCEFYTYDADHNVLTKTVNGVVTTYTRRNSTVNGSTGALTYKGDGYDALVSNIAYTLPSGATLTATAPVSYIYDAFGQRTQMTDGTGITTYSWIGDTGCLNSVTSPYGSIGYTYLPDNSRGSMSLPNGSVVTYAYDGVGRCVQDVAFHTYLDNGWLSTTGYQTTATGPNYVNYAYDPRGRISSLINEDADADLTTFAAPAVNSSSPYATPFRDTAGNLLNEYITSHLSFLNSPWIRSFTYDNRDVLLTDNGTPTKSTATVNFNQSWSHNYTVDPAFNLTSYIYCGAPDLDYSSYAEASASFSPNADNQASPSDAFGNTISRNGGTLTYDAENRLTSAPTILANTTKATFTYNGDGLRASKTIYDGSSAVSTTYYVYDGDEPVEEITQLYLMTPGTTGTSSNRYVSAINSFGVDGLRYRTEYAQPINGTSTSVTWTYLYDPSGNLLERFDASYNGEIDGALYDAYGTLRASTTKLAPAPFGFGGQYGYYTDAETGLVLCGARYYDPTTGHWLSRDPIGYAGGQNLYTFCDGNPVNEADPEGTDAVIFFGGDSKSENSYFRPGALQYASEYDKAHPGKRAYVFDLNNNAKDKTGWTAAEIMNFTLASTKDIDTIIYIGHAGITDSGSGGHSAPPYVSKLYCGSTDITTGDIAKLPTGNVEPGATIKLFGCDTAATTDPEDRTLTLWPY
jgi:RHS repeat-associated protein